MAEYTCWSCKFHGSLEAAMEHFRKTRHNFGLTKFVRYMKKNGMGKLS